MFHSTVYNVELSTKIDADIGKFHDVTAHIVDKSGAKVAVSDSRHLFSLSLPSFRNHTLDS